MTITQEPSVAGSSAIVADTPFPAAEIISQTVHVAAEPTGEVDAPEGEPVEHVSAWERFITLVFVVTPAAGVAFAIASLWGVGVDWVHLSLLVGMFLVSAMGITVGYHRLFSHRAFKTYSAVRVAFAIMGAMAAEGTVRRFVANHRRHHSHADRPGDPHSPHIHEGGTWNAIKGFWFAHTGWFMTKREHISETKYAPEFVVKSGVYFVDQTNGLWVLLGLLLPMAIGGIVGGTWLSAWLGLIWGGIVRIFLVHHITWSINSVCHIWGTRPFKSGDHSRNNVIFGILGMGEGWHNNHHAFPYSSRHGLHWWQIDTGWMLIRTLKFLGLAWDVRVPAKAAQAAAARRSERAQTK